MAYNNHLCPWDPPSELGGYWPLNPRLPCIIYNLVPRPVIWMGLRKNLVIIHQLIAWLAPVKKASLATLISWQHGFKIRKPKSFRTQVSRLPRNVLQKVLLIGKVINSVAKNNNNMFWSCCSDSSSVFSYFVWFYTTCLAHPNVCTVEVGVIHKPQTRQVYY